jgi:putative MATE family efflux protein
MKLKIDFLTYKKILNLALPAIAGLSTQMIVSLVDTAMIGRLDNATYALAAMGLGVLATWAVVSFFSSLATGTHVLIAQNNGAKDFVKCGRVLDSSIVFGFGVGIIVSFIFVYFSSSIANFFAADFTVGNLAGDYLFYRFMGIPFFLITVSFRGFYFGVGNTKVFMVSGILINLLNIIFNYIFIYGEFGVEPMGLAGAGLGSTLATIFDAFYYFFVAIYSGYRVKYNLFKYFLPDTDILKKILSISLPVSFQNVFILIGFLSFIAITGLIGTTEQAASQLVISSLFVSIMPCFGFGIAAQTLVATAIGDLNIKMAKYLGNETAKLATVYTVFVGLVFTIIPDQFLLIITTDRALIQVAIPALKIAGFGQIFYAIGVVLSNGLQSKGDSFFVMAAEVIMNCFIFVPAGYFFGVYMGYGLKGAWATLPVYIIIYSLAIFIKFNYGDWSKAKSIS